MPRGKRIKDMNSPIPPGRVLDQLVQDYFFNKVGKKAPHFSTDICDTYKIIQVLQKHKINWTIYHSPESSPISGDHIYLAKVNGDYFNYFVLNFVGYEYDKEKTPTYFGETLEQSICLGCLALLAIDVQQVADGRVYKIGK